MKADSPWTWEGRGTPEEELLTDGAEDGQTEKTRDKHGAAFVKDITAPTRLPSRLGIHF